MPKVRVAEDARKVWPMEFYEKLNLRTFFNFYTPYVKTYCNTYPRDFFSRDQVVMPDSRTVVMENSLLRLELQADELGKLVMYNESKATKAWDKKIIRVYYDEQHNDFRVDEVYIAPKSNCFYLIPKEDANSSVEVPPQG